MGKPVISNPIKCFRPILFALNNDPNSEKPMIDFLVKSGLTYLGKQNKNQIGFSRENVFGYGDFRLVISWMRNLATIVSKPDGWDGAFTEVYFDNIRECSTGYVGHYSLAFCYGDYEMMKIAIPNADAAPEPENTNAVTNVKFKKDWLVEDQDEDVGEDDKLKSISIYECCNCHWIFAGDCERYGYGYTSQSVQTPNYCPMCGAKIKDCID